MLKYLFPDLTHENILMWFSRDVDSIPDAGNNEGRKSTVLDAKHHRKGFRETAKVPDWTKIIAA